MTLSITQIIWNRLVGRLVNNKLEGTRKGKAVNSFNVSVCCWTGWVKQTKSLAMRPVSGQDLNQSLPKTNHWDCPFGQTHMKTNRAKGEKWHGESTAGLKGFVWACECVRACVRVFEGRWKNSKMTRREYTAGLKGFVWACVCVCVCVRVRAFEGRWKNSKSRRTSSFVPANSKILRRNSEAQYPYHMKLGDICT